MPAQTIREIKTAGPVEAETSFCDDWAGWVAVGDAACNEQICSIAPGSMATV